MDFWTPSHLAQAVGGRWLREPANPAATLAGLSIDTRQLQRGQVFLAVKGDRFDGHDFLAQAAGAGAAMAIVCSDVPVPPGLPTLLVDDTVAALQRLAQAYRDELARAGCKVIAVVGSNGKTTTRRLIHAALSARFRGSQSPKSFNNHLGVPLTILAASPRNRFVVVEIGSNHPGEVATLARIVRPDAAVVTSLGREHLEYFGSLEGAAREEMSILAPESLAPGGLAVLPDHPLAVTERTDLTCVRVGRDLSRRPVRVGAPGEPTRVELTDGLTLALPLPGEHNADNALSAVAVARWMGVPDGDLAAALARVDGEPMRMQVQRLGAVTLVNDAYNANPDSVAAALYWLASCPVPAGARRVAILGDMFELGAQGPTEHRGVGARLGELEDRIDAAVLIGELSLFTAEALTRRWPPDRVHAFACWSEELPGKVADLTRPGDLLLLKASRGMRLERIIPALEKRWGANQHGNAVLSP